MNEAVIAIVFDFDDTLGQETTSFLLKSHNIDPSHFYEEVNDLVKNAWDPPLAYLYSLLRYDQAGKIDLAKKSLQALGKKLPLFPGLPKAFLELKEYVGHESEIKGAHIQLEFYIVSGGIEEIILGNPIAKYVNGIFGCNFVYDPATKRPIGVKSAISFTEKTRFVHGITKGVSPEELRTNPYAINAAVAERRIPFTQMIYIGDGPSDIPCLSAVTHNGGAGIGVSSPIKTFRKGYELARGKRITVGPYTANYGKGSDMRKVLEETLLRMGLEIVVERKKHVINAPKLDFQS